MSRILFILKKRSNYGVSFGLLNSAQANVRSLNEMGHEAKLVQVIDNNVIDKEVHDYKPTHVIIEAIWVVPEKLKLLTNMYKGIEWYICIHSKTPFLANEGIAFPWIKEMVALKQPNLHIAANNKDFVNDLGKIINTEVSYLPNMYFPVLDSFKKIPKTDIIKIGCFGSMRPMKNHLEQAIAAILFAESMGKKLEFHINAVTEQKGENVLKNIRAVFEITGHDLIEHGWLDHGEFSCLISEMDLGLQVSLSESFNIVTADFVHNDIPIVVSTDVTWMPSWTRCTPTDTNEIITTLKLAYLFPFLKRFNKKALQKHNRRAVKDWNKFLNPLTTEPLFDNLSL